LRERHIGHFSRSFTLPENADTEQVSANFTGGVLRLTIKKKTETKKRVVQINGVGASLSQ
jgi:HSP20 family protein